MTAPPQATDVRPIRSDLLRAVSLAILATLLILFVLPRLLELAAVAST